ncbi:MAG: polyprenyl synthetase family protein [Deltaproteobacteria bacterium]|nr:polyprenyl synthetase family protein [Deltaproteobacteria bacterium]
MSFQLDSYLRDQSARVERLLEQALGRVAVDAAPKLREAMAYALLGGGKRLRPILVIASCSALGREPNAAELDFACALEMIHTYSLIHDDLPCMDDDDLRRGKPTVHKAFGEAMAVLAGDALLTDAFALAAGGSESTRAKLCFELATAAGSRGMVSGQVDDVDGKSATMAELQRVHARKTGALIRAACRGPAIEDSALPKLTTYGEQLGIAFQIADDILDATGDAKATGKATGKDAQKGRVGYPQLLGLDGARRAADEAAEAAVDALVGLPGDKEALEALARYTVSRDR